MNPDAILSFILLALADALDAGVARRTVPLQRAYLAVGRALAVPPGQGVSLADPAGKQSRRLSKVFYV